VLDPSGEDSVNRPVEGWPVPGFTTERLYLHANGSSSKVCSTTETTVSHDSESQNSSVVFSHVFAETTELVGYMNLLLRVEAVGSDDMELLVSVEKHDASGRAFTMAGVGEYPKVKPATGLLRVSHRALYSKLSTEPEPFLTHECEERLTPGQVVPVEIGLWPTTLRFHAGEQLVLTIGPAAVVPPCPQDGLRRGPCSRAIGWH
jgi:uncharacterized protein